MREAIPPAAFNPWMADFAHHRFGGAESTQMLLDRVALVLQEVRSSADRDAVWVTHAGVIRAATYLAAGGVRPIAGVQHWPHEAPVPGQCVCLNV